LAPRRYVASASIKGQCKRIGFHDYNPELEGALGTLQGAVATVIRNIITTDSPPVWLRDEHQVLAVIAIQRSRTVAAAENSERMLDNLLKVAYEEQAKTDGIDIWDIK
jgi:hypothetical protein